MPSGKKSRGARRATQAGAPPVRSKGTPRRRQASPRVLLAAGGLALAIAVAVVLAVALSGGSSSPPKNVPTVGSLANSLPRAADVQELFKGIPQKGATLGSAGAPVTLVEYVDLQCPYCQEFETRVFPYIVQEYVRTGKLKVVMRAWAFIGPDSYRGRAAVLAAAEQNKAFDYAELLYENQGAENTGWLSDEMVASAAASIPGLLVQKLLTDRSSPSVKAQAQNVDDLARADGVTGTPTLFVGKSGKHGTVVTLSSSTDRQTLVQAIEAALAS